MAVEKFRLNGRIFSTTLRSMDETQQLISEIDAFLASSGMAPSTFGQKAVRNWRIVGQIKAGSNVGVKTVARLRRFMRHGKEERAA